MTVARRMLVGLAATALAGFGVVSVAASEVGAATTSVPFAFTGATQTYTVPSDGSVCAVTVDVVGGNGNSGESPEVSGGTGGSAQATFAVSPGDVLSVDVGSAGGVSSGGTGGPAVFGGGGAGGTTTWTAGGAGGGGGATAVKDNGTTLIVAGGGGGAAQFFGAGGGGGNGGSAGGDGSQGGSGGMGGAGSGGSLSAGGAGGTAGGPSATAGTAGSAGVGGTGGSTTNNGSSGGGGGGGGYFGGGGGGAADNSGSGGGGGGGAGFAAPSASGLTTSSLTQDGSGNGVAQITPSAGSCPPVLTIHKAVTGQVPDGTTFTIHVECSHPVITGVSAQASQTTVSEDLTFDAAGNPAAGTNPRVVAAADDSCNVSETANGGATDVAYACTDNSSGSPAFCQSSNQDVQFGTTASETAAITVTNTFPLAAEAAPAAAVGVTPKFTG
jgi:hypothetical protein